MYLLDAYAPLAYAMPHIVHFAESMDDVGPDELTAIWALFDIIGIILGIIILITFKKVPRSKKDYKRVASNEKNNKSEKQQDQEEETIQNTTDI